VLQYGSPQGYSQEKAKESKSPPSADAAVATQQQKLFKFFQELIYMGVKLTGPWTGKTIRANKTSNKKNSLLGCRCRHQYLQLHLRFGNLYHILLVDNFNLH
jgi:hypothetical protein